MDDFLKDNRQEKLRNPKLIYERLQQKYQVNIKFRSNPRIISKNIKLSFGRMPDNQKIDKSQNKCMEKCLNVSQNILKELSRAIFEGFSRKINVRISLTLTPGNSWSYVHFFQNGHCKETCRSLFKANRAVSDNSFNICDISYRREINSLYNFHRIHAHIVGFVLFSLQSNLTPEKAVLE